ncbi:MAG: PQQ-dependent sugar dehydrogenase [Flavobacteriales bacterium]|nr:PQQ-dependent sugar dehydrogenase [Flavobacteriales bacterium]
MKAIRYLGFLLFAFWSCSSHTDEESFSAGYSIVADSLYQPWSVEEGPNDELWITDNQNYVTTINLVTGKVTGLNVLLDQKIEDPFAFFMHGLAFHPQFPDSSFVYLSYVYLPYDDTLTASLDVVRMAFDRGSNTLANPQYFVRGLKNSSKMIVGGRLLTTKDFLFVATSDERRIEGNSQDLESLAGKILRFNLDGSIPNDNPFKNSPIFTFGHRNPQGLIEWKGQILSSEHGPSDNDEINLLTKGSNYGWPLVSGGGFTAEEREHLKTLDIDTPIYSWTPTVAPSSLAALEQHGKSYLLVPTLKEADLRVLSISGSLVQERQILFNEELGRIRDVLVTSDNRVFLLTYNRVQGNFHYYHTPKKNDSYRYDVLVEVFLNKNL